MAMLPHPAPPGVRALASILSNLFRDAPPKPAASREQGLDPVCLRCAAWYQRPAAGGPAGCPACGSREALHLSTAGDQQHAWYRAFGDLALARLQAIGVLGLAPPPSSTWC